MTREPRKIPPSPPLLHKGRGRKGGTATAKHDPLDGIVDACARSLELKIDKAWRPAIRAHLQVTLRHGALVADFTLPDEAEPAPVFEP